MSEPNLASELTKLQKKIPADQCAALEALGTDDLRKRITTCEQNIAESERAQAADEALAEAKQTVKTLAAPYKDAIKAQRAQQRYALILLEQRGAE